ncbi:MAG: Na+/H+ antiporter NhaA [Pseudonocardia sp.]|nr:Na+/H+ antiporter NhaA [Pseudonocardia sp.]
MTEDLRVADLLLLAATAAALAWANSPWRAGYASVFDQDVTNVVNDGLMSLFFLLMAVEIRREWVSGELRDRRVAALPIVCAVGGMVVPALVYLAVTHGGEGSSGWGIPMATDIAFAIGVVALLGRRVPPGLRVFLLTLAIVDDVGAVLVIAVAYSRTISPAWLAGAAALVLAGLALRHLGVTALVVWAALGVALWVCAHESGIHPTLAGVAVGLLAPIGGAVERVLDHASSYLIVPLFALVNAGVELDGGRIASAEPVTIGVVAGLVVGKPLGISAAAFVATKLRLGRLPAGTGWGQFVGVATLAGIGFTVSLFVTDLAFDDPGLQADAKIGILLASAVAALVGSAVLVRAHS